MLLVPSLPGRWSTSIDRADVDGTVTDPAACADRCWRGGLLGGLDVRDRRKTETDTGVPTPRLI